MGRYLVGLDLGTTVCKAVVCDQDLHILGRAEIEYPLIKVSAVAIEQDAELWWNLSKRMIREAVDQSGIDAADVAALSISAQGISFVPVNERLEPIRSAFNWLDVRAREELQELLAEFGGPELFAITGKSPSEALVLPKLIWLRKHESELFERTHKFLMPLEFLISRFCGHCVTDHTMASGTYFYDIHRQEWADRILQRFQIPLDKLAELRFSGSAAGTILPDVAREIGLSADTIVAVGGQDQKCAALGAGIGRELVTISLGTATAITQLCDQPSVQKQSRIACCSYLFPRQWVLEGVVGTSCASLNWLRDTFYADRSYRELDEIAETCKPGHNSLFFYPFLTGAASPYLKSDARGFLYGISLSTDSAQVVRSVFEGVAFMIRKNLEVMNDSSMIGKALRVFGGGAKSTLWCRIIADICECPVETVFSPETASVGAAILAGMGCGLFREPGQIRAKIPAEVSIHPESSNVSAYRERYAEYLSVLERMIHGRAPSETTQIIG